MAGSAEEAVKAADLAGLRSSFSRTSSVVVSLVAILGSQLILPLASGLRRSSLLIPCLDATKLAMQKPDYYRSDYAALERWYASTPDPWKLSLDPWLWYVQARIVDLAERLPHRSILDVGCGEGHLTQLLCVISQEVQGIDVSVTAIERARKLASNARYETVPVEEYEPGRRFDLAVCNNVLHYPAHPSRALDQLLHLAAFVLVGVTVWQWPRLDALIRQRRPLLIELCERRCLPSPPASRLYVVPGGD